MRHEFSGASGRSKEEKKRSQRTGLPSAASPYASQNDLTALSDEDNDIVDALSAKSAPERATACAKLSRNLGQYVIPTVVASQVETTLASCIRPFTSAKIADSEKLRFLYLGTSLTLCCGSENPSLFSQWTDTLFWHISELFVSTAAAKGSRRIREFTADTFSHLSLMWACDQQLRIGDDPLPEALAAVLTSKNLAALSGDALGEALHCYAACCERHSITSTLSPFIHDLFADSEDFDVVDAAVESVGIANERFPGIFAAATIEPLQRVSAKAAGKQTKKDILAAVRAVLRFMEDGEQPTYHVAMRFEKAAIITGFKKNYWCEACRALLSEGFQRHLVSNELLRGVFGIREEFLSSPTRTLMEAMEAERARTEAKVELRRERQAGRKLKENMLDVGVVDGED